MFKFIFIDSRGCSRAYLSYWTTVTSFSRLLTFLFITQFREFRFISNVLGFLKCGFSFLECNTFLLESFLSEIFLISFLLVGLLLAGLWFANTTHVIPFEFTFSLSVLLFLLHLLNFLNILNFAYSNFDMTLMIFFIRGFIILIFSRLYFLFFFFLLLFSLTFCLLSSLLISQSLLFLFFLFDKGSNVWILILLDFITHFF